MSEVNKLNELLDIMARLRDPNTGCPWDIKQNFATIAPYTIEEAYEVADAIERNDLDELKLELGDLLLQVVFHAQMAQEQGLFNFDDVVEGINQKMVRRHPHVFGEKSFDNEAQVNANWEAQKQQEREAKGDPQNSILDAVTVGLPALTRALKLQKKAAKTGFDWPSVEPILDKIREELAEVEDELVQATIDPNRVEAEIGDLLFSVVNLARHQKVDPEQALRTSNQSFYKRFSYIEQQLKRKGMTLNNASLEQMDALWDEAKIALR
ncbi:nucleoside triphosphate pyrophosphohydrolase [Echinimonas agarilytica]|uniref:Nucleoside triphosphate pyrophosphohydrolase n=1 Tax=Echinimonas agarilytica TaxID=1215918 RepID=A0AA41W556_9GAMM|nr:nucleoside triphosphate pyrophosphohydrolase [Echinimonas agarilytica]MCM2678830.1 nucleoside triphosphate pyrophosphohydrolase [Echinimonas agarilytica]